MLLIYRLDVVFPEYKSMNSISLKKLLRLYSPTADIYRSAVKLVREHVYDFGP